MIKVAIVEDNKNVREGFRALINHEPDMMCICACELVSEALEKLPRFEPDVILMDIQLPDGTGIECTAKLKTMMPSVHIVVVTVYEDSVRIFQALQAGACGYLLKLANQKRIIQAIREAQEGGVPMTPAIARKVIGQFQNKPRDVEEIESLTPREMEVLELIMHGLSNKEIADRMGVSLAAVKFHLQHVYEKLHVHSRTDAALRYKEYQNPDEP
ncbi:MAG: response regulator transcription factor [Pontiellaceae bacterium]|nr:response regulator transcription factor [Pontiellaceae bacterium]MBN2785173.1 response regulator transcription factor [Pontiellaceae bacterium]